MQGAGAMVGGERESISACETKRGAEGFWWPFFFFFFFLACYL